MLSHFFAVHRIQNELYSCRSGSGQVSQPSDARGNGYPCTSCSLTVKHTKYTNMKKTLITLMALAGAACADEIPNDLNIAPGGNFWGGDFTLTCTLNEGVLSANDTIDVLALY